MIDWKGLKTQLINSKHYFFSSNNGVLLCGDCLEMTTQFDSKFFDIVLTDPPYGVTQNKEDIAVDLSDLFRVGKGIVLTTQQPYTTDVITQFRKEFRYDLVWDKVLTSGFLNANRMPLRSHEIILVFGKVNYNPQKIKGNKNHGIGNPPKTKNNNYGKFKVVDNSEKLGNMKYPKSIIMFKKPHPSVTYHRTQKPIELMEYLVKTYTNKNDIILDPFTGSGTTCVAAENLKRKWIGIEMSEKYCGITKQRIEKIK